jgi:hypothetical protein
MGSAECIMLRMMKLAMGGAPSRVEAHRMVQEKTAAVGEAVNAAASAAASTGSPSTAARKVLRVLDDLAAHAGGNLRAARAPGLWWVGLRRQDAAGGRENSDESAFPITLSCYPRQLDTLKIAIFRIDGPISLEPAKAMWFSLMEEAKMPQRRLLMAALDAALSAEVNLLFSKMASAASGADPEGRFAEGIKNASSFYDRAADIIRNVVQERQAALAQPRRRRRQARTS